MRRLIRAIHNSKSGQTITEYGIVMAVIALPVILAGIAMRQSLEDVLDRVTSLF